MFVLFNIFGPTRCFL